MPEPTKAAEDPYPALLERLLQQEPLSQDDARGFFDQVFDGQVPPERLAAVLAALGTRPVTADELVGFATAMRRHGVRIQADGGAKDVVLDNCGTGGAPWKAFNVSTITAFLVAGAGITVAKHGNRSFTRPSGSADILEKAGADLDLPPDAVEDVLEKAGIAFLFAPTFHPAMKHAGPVRKSLGVKTVFNLLGPLTNPAGATHQVLGVYDPGLLEPMAEALARLGCRSGYVLWGEPGFDEATPCGPVHHVRIEDGQTAPVTVVDPEALGMASCTPEEIAPVPADAAPALLHDLLAGKGDTARSDTVALNAAFALHAAGTVPDLESGVETARQLMTEGIGNAKLETYLAATRQAA